MNEVSGIGDTKRGIAATGADSATEATIIERNSNNVQGERLATYIDFIINVTRKNTQLMKQFFDRDKMLDITGFDRMSWNAS